jgi:heavy metal sensor kinase
MFNSVRIRLTLWYMAAMTLVVIGLAAATYFVLQKNVIRRADAQAVELADTFLSTVHAELAEKEVSRVEDAVAAALSEHRFRDVVFAVFGANGELLGVSETPQRRRDEKAVKSLWPIAAHPNSFKSVDLGGTHYRSFVRDFTAGGQPITLVVLQSLRRENEFLQTLALAFLIVIPVGVLLAGLGGYLLARRSLSPVVAMSAHASRIGAENLYERLTVQNPRDELGRLAESFNGLLDRLNESFERQTRFVADASHELRTPVAILCGETDVTLSQERRSEQEYRESVQILNEEAKRLKHIVEDLFTLARADAGQHPLAVTDFYLDELAAECCKNVRSLTAAKKITVACESNGELAMRGDETLVRRMLVNLLDNAIKYTAPGGWIALRSSQRNGSYCVTVEDSGRGIPSEMHGRVFERFFRVDKTRPREEYDGGGAGLGLAIASWIASAHSGSLKLTRSTPQGSLFTVLLPKSRE